MPAAAVEPPTERCAARYFAASVIGHLVWESAQLPLYTIWSIGSMREILFALFHCTAGDLLVASVALAVGLVLGGRRPWSPHVSAVIIIGVAYTIFSEWWNVSIVATWAYSDLMPTLPWLGTGLAPLLQWVVVPTVALMAASWSIRVRRV